MAVDTKTTAGGVVLFALSGSGSYLATNAISERENATPTLNGEGRSGSTGSQAPSIENGSEEGTVTPQLETEENRATGEAQSDVTDQTQDGVGGVSTTSGTDSETAPTSPLPSEASGTLTTTTGDNTRTETIQLSTATEETTDSPESREEESIDDSARTQADTTSNVQVQEPNHSEIMKGKMTDDKFEKISNESQECQEALNKPYDENNYKAAVKACYKGLTLEKRAEQLKITLLETTGQNNNETLKARFDSLASSDPHQMAKDSIAKMDWNNTKPETDQIKVSNLKEFCEKVKVLTVGTIFAETTNQPIETEWTNFLKMCAKETNVNKTFWTLNSVSAN